MPEHEIVISSDSCGDLDIRCGTCHEDLFVWGTMPNPLTLEVLERTFQEHKRNSGNET